MTKFAHYLRTLAQEPQRHQVLFRLEPPIEVKRWGYDAVNDTDFEREVTYEYIISSAISTAYAHETMIFGANKEGQVIDWLEAAVSRTVDVFKLIEDLGYTFRDLPRDVV